MKKKSGNTIGARLRQAIEQWRSGSIREFQREMQARGAPRSTYPTINSYLKDENEPPTSFFTEAASLLGVRPEWLAFGTGEQTDQQEAIARLAEAARHTENEPNYQAIIEAVPDLEGWSVAIYGAFLDTVVARARSAPDHEALTPRLYAAMARDLMTILSAPTQLWGIYDNLTAKEAEQYGIAMLNAVKLAIPEPGKGEWVRHYKPARSVLIDWLTSNVRQEDLEAEDQALTRLRDAHLKREGRKAPRKKVAKSPKRKRTKK